MSRSVGCPICGGPRCGSTGLGPMICIRCEQEWDESPERQRAAVAFSDFITRRRAERMNGKADAVRGTGT